MANVIALAIFTMALWPAVVEAGGAGPNNGCKLPKSDAEALVILNNYYPGYWWDHTDLTIAVQAHPRAKPAQLEAIADAIDNLGGCARGLFRRPHHPDRCECDRQRAE